MLWILSVIGAEVRAKDTKLTETIIPSKGKDSTASSTLDLLLVCFVLFLSIIDAVCMCVCINTPASLYEQHTHGHRSQKKALESSGTGILSGNKAPDVGARH